MVIRQIGSVVPGNTNTIRLLELTMKVLLIWNPECFGGRVVFS